MKVGLFVPCYIDQFFPEVGIATLQLLEKHNCEVIFPDQQTCCGQPMANTGMEQEGKKIYNDLAGLFAGCEYIVAPSPSCVHHIRAHYDIVEQTKEIKNLRKQTFDIVEFLVDILKIDHLEASFPHRVGLHQSCHGLRGMHLGKPSELMSDIPSKWDKVLKMVDGIDLAMLNRADECCGFGGTFAVAEEAVSVKMGKDRLADHNSNNVEVLTSGDMSCLMHLQGIAKRQKSGPKIVHIANILNGDQL
ncbi:(Fe-S)-binding protein [Autumnicola psychrophila]|uniref:(Fe-S)-binding protein n=1 Tax=Autumnicola psychrophila TaxID=3075592 RepID=A0ABU3DU19_9FLAO|nr:(Fe-S)-binding protein [Zunongwangia sp. F225]MDT0687211.1 (Fe-S)-binding protein [Zunongwangia sp. F225]